jgi:uncharacterized protein (DUF486 family)
MGKIIVTIFLLICSNIFMTFAWYSHLKNLNDKPWILASIASWSIALFEYLLQVPANRIGFQVLSLPQLKILQEVITISIFIPFSLLYMGQPIKWNHYVAMLFILGAVYFVFKK